MACERCPDRERLKRAIVQSAERQGSRMQPPRSAKELLQNLQDGVFGTLTTTMVNGKNVVSTSEAGGTVTFQIPKGMNSGGFLDLLQEILEGIDGTGRVIKRLRQCYTFLPP